MSTSRDGLPLCCHGRHFLGAQDIQLLQVSGMFSQSQQISITHSPGRGEGITVTYMYSDMQRPLQI